MPSVIRLGDYLNTLASVEVDAIITDPPYSNRTHSGHGKGVDLSGGEAKRREINYAAWDELAVMDFAEWSHRACRGWIVVLTDHILAPLFMDHLGAVGRYVFAPLPFVAPGSRVRLAGDGPSSWCCWIVVARPRCPPYSKWGTLPGAYVLPKGQKETGKHIGGKPLWLMRALVRDYSRPGDLVCDPCAGFGTTGLACIAEGRMFVGSELDESTHAVARKRLQGGHTAPLFCE